MYNLTKRWYVQAFIKYNIQEKLRMELNTGSCSYADYNSQLILSEAWISVLHFNIGTLSKKLLLHLQI